MSARTGLIAAVVLLGVGGVIDRAIHLHRHFSPAFDEGARRVATFPESIGTWAGESTKVDEALVKESVSTGGKVLQYRDGKTGHSVYVALLVGHPWSMTDQLPEKSFRSIGYAFDSESLRRSVIESRLGIPVPGTLVHMDFWNKDSKVPLRCWQGWFDGERWSRPDYSRWQFLNEPILYRLQVWSLMAEDPLASKQGTLVDPCRQFLIDALPTLTRILKGEAIAPAKE